jgi:hypothetical protein
MSPTERDQPRRGRAAAKVKREQAWGFAHAKIQEPGKAPTACPRISGGPVIDVQTDVSRVEGLDAPHRRGQLTGAPT